MNKQLQPHEQRVIEERIQLNERLEKLLSLLDKEQPSFIDDENWRLLNEQANAMNWYYTILTHRIKLF